MNRRDFITTASTATAAMALLTPAAWAEEKPEAAAPMGHPGHAGHVMPGMPAPNPHMALIQSASRCLVAGQVCTQHCMMMMSMGDLSLVECAKSVHDMLAVCTALQQLAVANSSHLPAMAKLAAMVCDACEKECRKHETMHMACKACAEACKACGDECRKIAA